MSELCVSWVECELREVRDDDGTVSHAAGPGPTRASSASTPADDSATEDAGVFSINTS